MVVPAILVAALTVSQWQSDISYLQTELPRRHPNLFFQLRRSEWDAALDDLRAHAAGYANDEMLLRMQQVVARVGDGHTQIDTTHAPQTYYPLRLYRFSDGIFVTKTTDDSRGACGARLVAIDGMDADEVYARVATLISHENDAWVTAAFASRMIRAEALTMLGVTSAANHARFTFEKAGFLFDLDLSASGANGTVLAPYAADERSPLYMRDPQRNYWYVFDAAQHLIYVKYNVCTNDAAHPFDAFAREIFAIADRERIDRFVVDVRNNGGGSTSVAQPLIDGLAQRSALRGRLYVIIGRETFSSGLLNALDLSTRAGAIIAGEPSGGKPNAYGEVKTLALPASGATVFYSSRLFQVVSGDPPSLEPAITVTLSSSDFFSRRDPVLETIAPMSTSAATVPVRHRAVSTSRTCPR